MSVNDHEYGIPGRIFAFISGPAKIFAGPDIKAKIRPGLEARIVSKTLFKAIYTAGTNTAEKARAFHKGRVWFIYYYGLERESV